MNSVATDNAMLQNCFKDSTVTKGKKGAVSVPFGKAGVPFSAIFTGFPLSGKF